MEFHNPTDVQSVPSVDALHVVNKKHKEEVDGLKAEMQSLRDNPESAKEAFNSLLDEDNPGSSSKITFSQPNKEDLMKFKDQRPKVAVLREQGVNSHVEMAVAFHRAGFEAVDVHMTDIISGRIGLDDFKGLVACGGFSYGDVLGAGEDGQNLYYLTLMLEIYLRISLSVLTPLHWVYVMDARCYLT